MSCLAVDALSLDLVDEAGHLCHLSEKENLREFASEFLEGRKKYILIKVVSE